MKRSGNGAAVAPLLEVKGITKRFPGVLALDKVDLQVGVGEVQGLVGKNGAGKSTLMKILMGLESPDAGQMALNGEPLTDMNPYRAKMLGIAYVPQEAQLVGPLTVGENIFCGELPIGRLGFVRWEEVHRQAAGMLDRLGQRIETHLKVEDLSVGQRQVVSIAKALFAGACLIILDEPTAPLTRREVETLFDLVRSLKGEGVSFIYISHYLGEVFEVCDDVTVLRNGRHVATRPVTSLTEPELARLMVGGEVEQAERSSVTIGEPVLTVRGFSKAGRFEDVTLEVHEGEIVGLTGLAGCGKSELALAIFGLDPPDSGEIYLNGRRLEISTPAEAFREGIAYLPEDRHKHGLVPGRSVAQNITLAILRQICDRLGFIDGREERAVARRFQDALEIMTPTLDREIQYLSGGNQQKVIVSKLLATTPRVLLLGDPTRGIDVEAKAEVYRIVDELSTQGMAILIISDEISELLSICDRILVMFRGRITAEFESGQVGPDQILMVSEGVNV